MAPDRSLRVHVVIDSLETGGAQALLPGLAAGAQRTALELSVTYLHDRAAVADRLREHGVEPQLVQISSLLGRADRLRIRRRIAATAPDLVHTHLGYADLLGGLAARSLRVPSISTLHQADWLRGNLRGNVKDLLQAAARRWSAPRVIAVSEGARARYLARRLDSPGRVVVVHNGIYDSAVPGAGAAVRSELGIAADDLLVTMISVLRKDKVGGHDASAAAVRSLLGRCPRLRLLVVGEGPERPRVEAAVGSLGRNAIMTGHRNDVAGVLDATDVLVHPAHLDAFPNVLLESLAAGVPVVATAVGGIPEIVDDGFTGTLIAAPPEAGALADALAPLLADASLRQRYGEAARRRFEARFTIDRWIERLLPIYEEVIRIGAKRRTG